MKNRLYTVLLIIAALCLVSCGEKLTPGSPDAGGHSLVINLKTVSVSDTKASGTDAASIKESKINSVELYLVKADAEGNPDTSAEVVKISPKSIDSTTGKVDAEVTGLKGNTHLLYVLVNRPSDLSIDTDSYAEFIGSYTGLTSTVLGGLWDVTNQSFFMVNSVAGNTSSATGAVCKNGGVLLDFSSGGINVNVVMERLAVKIVAKGSDFVDFSPFHTKVLGKDINYVVSSIALDKYALINCVNSFNLLQKYGTDELHDNNVIVSPSSAAGYSLTSGYYYTDPASLTWIDAADSCYCLENNAPYYPADMTGHDPAVSDTKMKGRVTGVVFRAQIKLADGFDGNAHIGDDGSGEDIDHIGGGPGFVQTKGTYNTNIVKTVYKYKGVYYGDLTRLKSDNSSLSSCADNTALRNKGVKIYEDGYMYYTYWIDNNGYTNTSAPYYCVERNKSYRLTVTYIAEFGDDLPCGATYDKEDPIDRAIPRMYVDLSVAPWDSVSKTYDIQ